MSFSDSFKTYTIPLLSEGNIPYTHGRTSPSWNKRGEEIPNGKVKDRLFLGQTDTRVHVKAQICETLSEKIIAEIGCLLGLYTKLDDKTYVNIASIKKRLHVNSREIQDAIQKGHLHCFLKIHAQETSMVLKVFEDIIEKVDRTIRSNLSNQKWMEEIRHIIQNRDIRPSRYTKLNFKGEDYHLGFNPATKEIALCTIGKTRGNGNDSEIRNFTDLVSRKTVRIFKENDSSSHSRPHSRSSLIPNTIAIEAAPREWIILKNSTGKIGDYIQIE